MIRVLKSEFVPNSLETTSQYNGEDVVKQLHIDQNGKCYLCERHSGTDYQVEHRLSQAHFSQDRLNWDNLLLGCSYCNKKKSNNYDNIVNPTHVNVEEVISQRINYETKMAVFDRVDNMSLYKTIDETIELLGRIYNGTGRIRKHREELFFYDFISEMNKFNKAVCDYLSDPSVDNDSRIRKLLSIEQEFLGFKYWIIKDNDMLEKFSDCCIWHKV